MQKLSVREVRAALSRLEIRLEQEGELVITRNGAPRARAAGGQARGHALAR